MRTSSRGLSLLLLSIGASAYADPPSLIAKPTEIEPGGSATLKWQGQGADPFLFGVGRVEPIGTKVVTPIETTTYYLTVATMAGIETVSTTVVVAGTKGDAIFKDPDADFHSAIFGTSKTTYTRLLAGVFDVLQNKRKFRVRGLHLPRQTSWIFYTNLVAHSLPPDAGQSGRVRRLAYFVRISEPKSGPDKVGNIGFEIRAYLEVKLRAEPDFERDNSVEFNTQVLEDLKKQIEAIK